MTRIVQHNGHNIVDGVFQPKDFQLDGRLNLEGCTALTALPEGLRVTGSLNLRGCTALTALPADLRVGGDIDLIDCTALAKLPERLHVNASIRLAYCTALTTLPDVGLRIDLESLFIDVIPQSGETCIVVRDCGISATARTLAVGRRLGDMIDHWVLSWNGIGEKIITSIRDANPGEVEFYLNS